MRIGGFQKLSLSDYPSKTCSVVFTQGCPFRCAYCHNPDLISATAEGSVPEADVLGYLAAHRNMLDGVTVTGGEPTMQPDLPAFLAKAKALGLLVKLDTNGTNPAMVRDIVYKGLADYIAMDLKHTWERYADVVKVKNDTALANCRETFGFIQASGVAHEFRTTVYPGVHAPEDFLIMASYLAEGEAYYLQDIRYDVTLDTAIDRAVPRLDVLAIAEAIRAAYPALTVGAR